VAIASRVIATFCNFRIQIAMTISACLSRFNRATQKRYPAVLFHGDTSRREIALTLDDGPHPRDTPQVLDALTRHDVRGTFFLVGQDVEQYPLLVKQIHHAGHQLAIHCYRHVPFPLENASTLKRQLEQSRKAIARASDIPPETICHARQPYGLFTKKILSLMKEWGYQLVLWDNMPFHFIQPAAWTVNQIIERTVPGSILVLHDGKGHGSKVAQILNIVIPQLKAKGLEFVTIEQMQKSMMDEAK
jgi:peptidoglycan/xylan/chitin deacetylase (PgdA/CDA1 family)